MKPEKIQRSFDFEVRAESDEKNGTYITGRPIVFNSVTDIGWFDEVIERGALDNTDLKDVRFLVNHDTSKLPLARSRNNNANSTMQMEIDDSGMSIRVNLDTERNTDAMNLYSAVERGDVTGMSFMFAVDADTWENLDSDHPTRHITSVSKVWEVSACTFPAYESSSISARDAQGALESARAALESERRQIALEKLKLKIKMSKEI